MSEVHPDKNWKLQRYKENTKMRIKTNVKAGFVMRNNSTSPK
jgi:hypothetical protein